MIPPELLHEVLEWIADDPDEKTRLELESWVSAQDVAKLKAAFSGFLEFGTAGLRGPLGPGPSRMNRAVVSKTALGLARFMAKSGLRSIVIGRDARHGSEDFTQDTAEIMSGAGFEVFVLPRPLPTPVLAFAVRKLKCDVGVMVTASHNPPQDNGYKVYLGGTVHGIEYNGSQIIAPTDRAISEEIALAPRLRDAKRGRNWKILPESVIEDYITETANLAPRPANLQIVYTAMHGVGKEVLSKVFQRAGMADLIMVSEQSEPDPDFPTVAFPNPEEPGAIDLALAKARSVDADLVIANDPDADRCALAIKEGNSDWRMLRGDEVGIILGEYLAKNAPDKIGVFANSIVSSAALRKIAAHYQVPFAETLTGFKYLAKVKNLRFGYEEALGYCVDARVVNDKDGISAALLLAQIAADLHRNGQTIAEFLDEIWARIGFHGTKQISIRTRDLSDIDTVMGRLRNALPSTVAGYPVTSFEDLERPSDGLPPTNGVRIWLAGSYRVIVRPSGTEPKIKCYIEVVAPTSIDANPILEKIEAAFRSILTIA